MPTPMMPQVPTSMRFLGLYMSTIERVKSSAFAPSLTSIASGFALTMSRTTFSALWKFIGVGLFASVSAIFATLPFFFSATAFSHSAGGLETLPRPASSALTQEPISPTSGASMRTLLSASCGEMSTWMNFWPPQSLWPLPPGLALAVREQPVQARADQHHHVGAGQHEGARGRGTLLVR